MEYVSLGRKLSFALLKLELWRCWREHCGCCYTGHFVDQDEGDGLCFSPAFEIDSRYSRGDRYYAGYTTNFEVLGGGFPRHLSFAFKAILGSMAWLFAV